MVEINKYITKNDMLFFQNEVFGDLKKLESSINTKISKLYENLTDITKEYNQKFDYFTNKINDLLQLLSVNNLDHEKVEELYKTKNKMKDEITCNKNTILMHKKILDSSIYKYDRLIIDNLELPGVIGYNCKFKNLRTFLDFTHSEINSYKEFKTQQAGEIKAIKDKIERVNQKLEISNKETIQKCDFIFANKLINFKREYDRKIEEIKILEPTSVNNANIDLSQLEQEIKKSQELSNQMKYHIEKEINDIKMQINENKETIDANNLLIDKQKDDMIVLREEFDELNYDFKNLKAKSKQWENKTNFSRNKSSRRLGGNENSINKTNSKNKREQKITFKEFIKDNNNIDNENDNTFISKKSTKTIKKLKKEKSNLKRKNTFINDDVKDNNENNENNENNNDNKKNDEYIKIKKHKKIKKKQKSLTNANNEKKNIFNLDNNEDELIINRKNNKKLLTYCFKNNLRLDSNEYINNKELELSSSSFSLLNEKEDNKQFEKKKKNNEKLNIEFINEKINMSLNKFNINKKINKNVSKLIKLKPIEKPIAINTKIITEKKNNDNTLNTVNTANENVNINNDINDTTAKKEKTVGITLNVFNKCKIKKNNKINLKTYNNNSINNYSNRKLNLTDKELLSNYIDNLIEKSKENNYNSLSNALFIKNFKNAFTSADQNKIKNKDSTEPFNDSQRNSKDENNYSRNDSNNYTNTSLNRNNHLSPLYNTNSFFYNKDNVNECKDNDTNILNGFLTGVPIISPKSNNEKEDDEKIKINQKIKKMNNKLNQISYNIKIIIRKLNLLEINYKPLNSQIKDFLMIILLIYKFLKKKYNNNKKIKYDFFEIANIKFPSNNFNNINMKKQKGYSSINNKPKNYLYTSNGISLEEGGLLKTGQTKQELDIMLKKIEPFLIKHFKDTI